MGQVQTTIVIAIRAVFMLARPSVNFLWLMKTNP